eukprot:Plantae.Rhodophyta-Palmaria_palmata.ctg13356.p1 GENE.Plantae.Rhodophyta-Palmaria_palmata.ctg13356~~Plantae.Rhodophyta-Palmaria_palmata.ctg13356.p1  ORF type:complete len:229 (-),score=25.59 Plantae.Rhodophyta-Palmaria_palmata.ctg13356:58-744(-)
MFFSFFGFAIEKPCNPAAHLEPSTMASSLAFSAALPLTVRTTSLSQCLQRPVPSHKPLYFTPMTMAARPRPSGNSSKRRFDPTKAAPPPQKKKLDPEEVFFEGRTSWTELVIPTLSILTVVGIIPFTAALARYLWVTYKVTSRRISVDSGFQGKDHVEIVYSDIASVRYVRRAAGASADCVLELKDGAKLELRAIPNWDGIFEYVRERLDDEAKAASGPATGPPPKKN